MTENGSFKERVRNEAVANAGLYKQYYLDYEYLVCSEAFKCKYKKVKADGNNYLHLIGVNSTLTANEFWTKCIDGTLSLDDFDFRKPGQNEKAVKGSVRQKIMVLNRITSLFDDELIAEENFHKNKIECAFATSDNICTLGFAASGRPKSLMKSNELTLNAKVVDLVFRKRRNIEDKYMELYYGNDEKIKEYETYIRELISEKYWAQNGLK